MKLKFVVFWLVSLSLCGDFLAMEHAQGDKVELKKSKVKNLNLSEVKNNINTDHRDFNLNEIKVDTPIELPSLDTIQLLYEAILEKKLAKKKSIQQNVAMSSRQPETAIVTARQNFIAPTPRQMVQPLKNELARQVDALQESDPDLYASIMDFKSIAEANGRTSEEIASFIQQNLDQLPKLKTKNVYEHLYHAEAEKKESEKKKDYELYDVLSDKAAVDHSTLCHVLLYRSASVKFSKEEAQLAVEKHKNYLDVWLDRIKEDEPEAYALLMQAYEQTKNKNLDQQSASLQILDAINQTQTGTLQLLLKQVEKEHEVKEATTTTWDKAYKTIGVIIAFATVITTGSGGVLGGLFGASKTAAVCTLAACCLLINNTSIINCTNTTG